MPHPPPSSPASFSPSLAPPTKDIRAEKERETNPGFVEMGESSSMGYWENLKAYWRTKFFVLDDYKKITLIPEKPLPIWSASDIEKFIASNPVHGLTDRKIADAVPSNWQNACYIPTKSDALVGGFRRWLKKYGVDEVPWGPKLREGLPPSPSKQQLMDRYWSHVVQCSSCSVAEKGLKALEMSLQVLSLGLIGVVAAMKKKMMSSFAKNGLISMAIACFLASKWLTNFIYKSFHFHDYNHALK